MSQPLIQTVDLCKYFKTRNGFLHAVDGVSITIPKGKTLGVVGESGCGKSTLGRVILRLIPHTSGQVFYEGQDILSLSKREMGMMRRKAQIIFQDPSSSLDPRATVSDTIAEPIRVNNIVHGAKAVEDRVKELMDTVGLAQRFVNTYPHELDGGRRQRVGIARALAVNPEFIVCDEPVSALDVSIQAQILNLLMDLQEDMGLTYMFVTHNLSVVKHISSEIVVMYLGQCVEQASSDELFSSPMHPYTQALLEAIPRASIEEKYRERSIIRGEVASPIEPKPGCRFAPRCPYACEECRNHDLKLQEISPGHKVACTRCNVGTIKCEQ